MATPALCCASVVALVCCLDVQRVRAWPSARLLFVMSGDAHGCSVALTKDHRPYHEDEKARIEQMGGSVVLGTDGTQRLMGLLESSRGMSSDMVEINLDVY